MPRTKSILRYPGGKAQLAKFVSHLLEINSLANPVYCEPFSGGSGISMELLLTNKVGSIILNDLDPAIYSIWFATLNHSDQLINDILNIPISIDEWYRQKEIYNTYREHNQFNYDLALATLFLNRTNRAGIITGGPIGGYQQSSKYAIDCRFNKQDIVKKIKLIATQAHRIHLYMLDAKDLIHDILMTKYTPQQLFTFFDPPYYKQGHVLYKNSFKHEDHINLYNAIRDMDNYYWITTYDYCEEIATIYRDLPAHTYQLQYSANKTRKENEYIFNSPITLLKSFDKVILT